MRREIVLRSNGRVICIPLSRIGLFGAILVLGAAGAWIGHASIGYLTLQRVVTHKDREIAQTVEKNQNLVAKMGEMREQFSDVAGTLEHNHRDLANLLQQNHRLKRDIGDVEQKLKFAEAGRSEAERGRQQIDRKLAEIRRTVKQAETTRGKLLGDLDALRARLTEALAARDRMKTARSTLDGQVNALEDRLVRMRRAQAELLGRVTKSATAEMRRAERAIARTGLKVETLLKRSGVAKVGQGGPFIPFSPDSAATEARGASADDIFEDGVAIYERHMERIKQIRHIVGRLPLAAPLAEYRLSSKFGRRRDPVNKKWARHEGIDLAGKLRAPVQATAPGKVVFAGWKGRFGRFIVIDHGMGIRTRYGHLRRIMVKSGQRVRPGQVIGQLGNSGRSTGSHLHYEILIDGRPVNPMKFLKAGKDVLEG